MLWTITSNLLRSRYRGFRIRIRSIGIIFTSSFMLSIHLLLITDYNRWNLLVAERREGFDASLPAHQVVAWPPIFIRGAQAHLNRILKPEVLDVPDNDLEFPLVAVPRIQNPNPLNRHHFHFIIHAGSSEEHTS